MDGDGVVRVIRAATAAGLLGLVCSCTSGSATPAPERPAGTVTTGPVASGPAASSTAPTGTAAATSAPGSAPGSAPTTSATPSTSTVGNAPALAAELLALGDTGDPAPAGPVVTLPGSGVEIGVVSLVSDARGTVLVLALRSRNQVQIPPLYTAEDLVAWRDLHTLRVRDRSAATEWFPYRYQRLPGAAKQGSTSPAENILRTGVWRALGAVVLPPLPSSTDSVDVLLGTPTSGLLTPSAAVTLRDVPVHRS